MKNRKGCGQVHLTTFLPVLSALPIRSDEAQGIPLNDKSTGFSELNHEHRHLGQIQWLLKRSTGWTDKEIYS